MLKNVLIIAVTAMMVGAAVLPIKAKADSSSAEERLGEWGKSIKSEKEVLDSLSVSTYAETISFSGNKFLYYIRDNTLYYGNMKVRHPNKQELIIRSALFSAEKKRNEIIESQKKYEKELKRKSSAALFFAGIVNRIEDFYTDREAKTRAYLKLYKSTGRRWDIEAIIENDYNDFIEREISVKTNEYGKELSAENMTVREFLFAPEKVNFEILGAETGLLTRKKVLELYPNLIMECVTGYSGKSGVGVNGKVIQAPREEDQGVIATYKDGRIAIHYSKEFFEKFDLDHWGENNDIKSFAQMFMLVKDGRLPRQTALHRIARERAVIAQYPDGTMSYIRIVQGTLLETALNLMKLGVKDALLCDTGSLDNAIIKDGANVVYERRVVDGTTSRFVAFPQKTG